MSVAATSRVSQPSAVTEMRTKPIINLGDVLLATARLHPERGLRFMLAGSEDESAWVSYATLVAQARRILGGLRAHGLQVGSKVALLLEKPGDFIPAFWACVLGGYVPCPLVPIRNDTERWTKHLAHINALLESPLVVTVPSLRQDVTGLPTADLDELRAASTWEETHSAAPSEPAILMLTSGSTGHSKVVELTHANLLASLAARAERQQLGTADTLLNWIAFDHVAALLESHMIALYAGAMQLHSEPAAILADPLRFLHLIDRWRVSVAFAPNFLLGQINAAIQSAPASARYTFDLSCLRRIVTGGEANVVDTGIRFLELLAPYGLQRRALWPAFGMTETCAACVYSHEFPDLDAEREFATVGWPLEGLEMRIMGEDGSMQPAGDAGELQLRGPMIFRRYYRNEEATRSAFTEDGWFRTGDLGCIQEGRLRLVGRSKDCIIVSGVNYYSHELEAALEQLDGIAKSFVAAFARRPKGADTEQLVVAFATDCPLEDEAELHRLVIAVRNTAILLWGFRPALILPLHRDAFPKTSLGKIQRSLMRRRLEAGELSTYETHIAEVTKRQLGGYSPPNSSPERALAQIYAELFGLDADAVSATASFFDLGGTSLDTIKLTMQIARRFGVRDVTIATVLQNPSVRELAERVHPGARAGKRHYDPIVPLQLTGRKTPLFCIHPAVGEVLVYVNLAKYFVNDRPFYAIRARGFNEGESHFSTLEEIVEIYVDAIRKRQPHGPYAIAGYSFGGIAGFEVAKRLEAQGERVPFFCSIDMPPYVTEPIGPDYCTISLAYFLSLIPKERMLEFLGQYRGADPNLCQYLMSIAPPQRVAELNLTLPALQSWAALTYSLGRIAKGYEPSGDVERVTVLYTRPQGGTHHDWLKDWVEVQIKRWDALSRSENRYIEVPGEHASLMDSAHVAGFQGMLRSAVDLAMNE